MSIAINAIIGVLCDSRKRVDTECGTYVNLSGRGKSSNFCSVNFRAACCTAGLYVGDCNIFDHDGSTRSSAYWSFNCVVGERCIPVRSKRAHAAWGICVVLMPADPCGLERRCVGVRHDARFVTPKLL